MMMAMLATATTTTTGGGGGGCDGIVGSTGVAIRLVNFAVSSYVVCNSTVFTHGNHEYN
jgi:hypothetical protein